MRTTNETYTESNYSSFMKESSQKNTLGYFPLLKFNENLYNICYSKFSKYLNNKKDELKLIINNKINQQISIDDYINNSNNDLGTPELTPIPSISKRKIKNEGQKKELKNFQRNVVLMRRLEYTNKMKEKNMQKKYKNKSNYIIYLQKIIRGYLVRKVIKQINLINESLKNFAFLISFYTKKKYFYFFKDRMRMECKEKESNLDKTEIENNLKKENYISGNLSPGFNKSIHNVFYNNIENEYKLMNKEKLSEEEKNDEKKNILIKKEKSNFIDDSNNIFELNKEKNINYNKINNNSEDFYINKEIKQNNSNTDININNIKNTISKGKISMAKLTEHLNEIKNENNESNTLHFQNIVKYHSPNNIDSIIENDDYVNFSGKSSLKNNNKIIYINDNILKNEKKKNQFNFTINSNSINNLRKTKTEIIQRQFRKYLNKKGYYGNFDKKKIIIIYLLKNRILYNIKLFLFNILKLVYKDIVNISITQEDNYLNLSSERIENVEQIYNFAINHINFN